MIVAASSLPFFVQQFFQEYLPVERNVSPNTVLSYRDALKLFFGFVSAAAGRSPHELTFEDLLDPERVRGFLRWLSEKRHCEASTRNQRLAALKTFARFVASRAPEHLDRCRQIHATPRARVEHREVKYLLGDEVRKMLTAIVPQDATGIRDQALLLLLYNTGARVQEVADLSIGDLRLEATPVVRLRGKGRKERTCPLWSKTVEAIRRWVETRGRPGDDAPLFLNCRGQRITRSGIAYVLQRAAQRTGSQPFERAKRVTPHVMRHTTAMHMLQAGVDLTVIASWLGHALLATTHQYVEIDVRMKEEALAAATALPELREGTLPPDDILEWLDKLGRRPRYVEPKGPESPLVSPAAGNSA